MVQARTVGRWLAASLLACSADLEAPVEGKFPIHLSDRPQLAEFVVHLDGNAMATQSAQLRLQFYSDGSSDAELSFEVANEDDVTSVVLKPLLEQLSSRDFQVEITNGTLRPGSANVLIAGEWMERGLIHVTIEPGGTISGSTSGLEQELSFEGKAVIHCMVPASQSSSDASVPVSSTDSAGEVLWLDATFATDTCREAKDSVGLPD